VCEGEKNPEGPSAHGYTGEGQEIRCKVDPRSSGVPGPFQNGHFRGPPN
jgi:hypothetical protein